MNIVRKSCGCLLFIFFCGASLLALQAGDPAAELRADFVLHGPVAMTGPVEPSAADRLRVLVFFRPRLQESRNLMTYLMDLSVRYPKIDIAAVSPDGKAEAKEFFSPYGRARFSGAADIDLQSSKAYLSGQTVYPYSFIMDSTGMILWDGEAADLDEALNLADRKMLNAEQQRKLSPLLADLRSRFRNGEERMAQYAAEKIFALDPANSTAIRIRLFMLQGAGRYQEAWDFLETRRKAAPKSVKIYFQQLDLSRSMAANDGLVSAVGTAYRNHVPVNLSGDSAMAWQLLTRRPFDGEALRLAGQLIGRAMTFRQKAARVMQLADADLYASAALYSSRLGKLDKALHLQKKATEVLKKTALHRVDASQKMEQYYQTARDLTAPRKPQTR